MHLVSRFNSLLDLIHVISQGVSSASSFIPTETHLSFLLFLSFQGCEEIDYFQEDVAATGSIALGNVGILFYRGCE